MDSWMVAITLKPIALILFFGLVVLPIEFLLYKFFPECRLKVILFDRTFQKRRPWTFGLVWLVLMVILWGYIAFVIETGAGSINLW